MKPGFRGLRPAPDTTGHRKCCICSSPSKIQGSNSPPLARFFGGDAEDLPSRAFNLSNDFAISCFWMLFWTKRNHLRFSEEERIAQRCKSEVLGAPAQFCWTVCVLQAILLGNALKPGAGEAATAFHKLL